jgi:hypothetical protein
MCKASEAAFVVFFLNFGDEKNFQKCFADKKKYITFALQKINQI